MSAYKIGLSEKDGRKELRFSGNLIINNIEKIYNELQELLIIDKPLSVFVENPENIDITFIQLIVSIKKACLESNVDFKVEATLKDDYKQLIEKAGLEKEITNK